MGLKDSLTIIYLPIQKIVSQVGKRGEKEEGRKKGCKDCSRDSDTGCVCENRRGAPVARANILFHRLISSTPFSFPDQCFFKEWQRISLKAAREEKQDRQKNRGL